MDLTGQEPLILGLFVKPGLSSFKVWAKWMVKCERKGGLFSRCGPKFVRVAEKPPLDVGKCSSNDELSQGLRCVLFCFIKLLIPYMLVA